MVGSWGSSVAPAEEVESFGGLGFPEKSFRALMKAKLGELEEGRGGLGNQLSKKEPRLMDAIGGGLGFCGRREKPPRNGECGIGGGRRQNRDERSEGN